MRCLLVPEVASCARIFILVEHLGGRPLSLAAVANAAGLTHDRAQRQLATLRRLGFVQVTRLKYGLRVQTSVPPHLAAMPAISAAADLGAAPTPGAPPALTASARPAAVPTDSSAEILRDLQQRALALNPATPLLASPTAPAAPAPAPVPAAPPAPAAAVPASAADAPLLPPELVEPELAAVVARMQHELNRVELTRDKIGYEHLRSLALQYRARLDLQDCTNRFVLWITSDDQKAAAKRKLHAKARLDWVKTFLNHVEYTARKPATGFRRRGHRDAGPTDTSPEPASAATPPAQRAEYTPAELDAAWASLTEDQRAVLVQVQKDDALRMYGASSPVLAQLDFAALARRDAARAAHKRALKGRAL